MPLGRESLGTKLASERLFFCMGPHVNCHIPFFDKWLIASLPWAYKWLFSALKINVIHECAGEFWGDWIVSISSRKCRICTASIKCELMYGFLGSPLSETGAHRFCNWRAFRQSNYWCWHGVWCGHLDCQVAWNAFCMARMGNCIMVRFQYTVQGLVWFDRSFYINLCKMHLLYAFTLLVNYSGLNLKFNKGFNYYRAWNIGKQVMSGPRIVEQCVILEFAEPY